MQHANRQAALPAALPVEGSLNGSALEGGGRGTTILRREANVWKIIHEHLSQFPQRHRSGRLRGSLG
ncbi:hypothetical protein GOB91_29820 [Sinorhizobium meliloti]|uniref:nuclear transport factor 2 family protein n=1 Tax=Rhizobium meliloti TaxID=382 RepID=UPI0009B8930C|nr:hypothetical protein CDO23_05080 [Sinorhizobium meliloti]MCO6425835.1 nuclear transport factor 2 family protein [Sinorhizobium meliloti]MDW9407741.1 hypothetical protein [Sinorhizobium meliloti]MDW9444987.1 hypothetical protein [Sinorhizobium meliloti]MDW9452913.1 hypothetical protein [Sinorhizobium meliloti]